MIPRTLQIKNFLSYGPEIQTISFEPYHLICLSGKNGHGKSAMLDAITWALWGCARKVINSQKADQGLLHLGQTSMMVIFDFEVQQVHYRVKRSYEIVYGKPYTTLEFGMINTDAIFMPLTDKTIRTTQLCIDTTIGLDFDTFVNSAFVRQGNANEFSKRSPKDRKEIITAILGLQSYDTLRKAALDTIKEATIKKATINALQEKIHKDLEQERSINTEAQNLEISLTTCNTQQIDLINQIALCTQEKQILNKQERARDICTFTLTQHKNTLESLLQELRTIRNAWRITHYATMLHQNAGLDERRKKLVAIIKEHSALQQTALNYKERIVVLREMLQTCIQERETVEQTLKQEITHALEQSKTTLHTSDITLKHINQEKNTAQKEYTTTVTLLADMHKQLGTYVSIAETLTKKTALFDKRKETYQRLVAYGNMLKSELNTLQQKIDLSENQQDPSCPLCEQNLSTTHRHFLLQKLMNQAHNIHHRYERLKRILPQAKQMLISEHEAIGVLQKQQEEFVLLQTAVENHSQKQQIFSKKIDELEALYNTELHKYQQIQLIINQYTHALTLPINTEHYNALKARQNALEKELKEHTQQLQLLTYDQATHEKYTTELTELDVHMQSYATIKQQMVMQEERKKSINVLCIQIKNIKKEYIQYTQQLSLYAQLEEQIQNNTIKAVSLQNQYTQCSQEKERLLQEKGRLEAEKQKIALLAKEYEQNEKTLQGLHEHIYDYTVIAQAASKDGIQALLIEDAIPEIEQEANDILSKLTNNQAHISIESLRDLKKGGTKETLDINISDAAGIRPYELFSGGEAFRIDFALRIAISKLLARRAGTALQTLIIDEGFGSQDEEGLAHIMDAMYKIQYDFAKIIIVSHLHSMKDQFPVHFVVEKNARGSIVHVIENG